MRSTGRYQWMWLCGAFTVLVACTGAAKGIEQNSVTSRDITWTFDAYYPVGRFVGGDWYVVAPNGLTITSVSPGPGQYNGRNVNGTEVNPLSHAAQGFDERPGHEFAPYDPNLAVSFPYQASPNESVCSTISWTNQPTAGQKTAINQTVNTSIMYIKSLEVLTVLASDPGDGLAFRPPYFGTQKPIILKSSVRDYSEFCPMRLPPGYLADPVGYAFEDMGANGWEYPRRDPATYPRVSDQIARWCGRPWMLHLKNHENRYAHPTDNMWNYYREGHRLISLVSLAMCCDLDRIEGPGSMDTAAEAMIQLGIDSYYAYTHGVSHRANNWFPILFAGQALGNADFTSISQKDAAGDMAVLKFYYYPEESRTTVRSSIVAPNELWNPNYRVSNGKWPAFCVADAPGTDSEYEHLHPGPSDKYVAGCSGFTHDADSDHGEWDHSGILYHRGTMCCKGAKMDTYRRATSKVVCGYILAMIYFNMQDDVNDPAVFDYFERYTYNENLDDVCCRKFVSSMVNEYWDNNPPGGAGGSSGSTNEDPPSGGSTGGGGANANRSPAIAFMADRSTDENVPLIISIPGSDPDGDPLAYAAVGLPSGAFLNGPDFHWTPSSAQLGLHEITFVVSDGRLQDSETIVIFVASLGPDATAPAVAAAKPAPGAIQVPLNNLVRLHVVDTGRGVDANTMRIQVNGDVVYEGNVDLHTTSRGTCRRSGTRGDFQFTFLPNEAFDFDQTVTVKVDAADLAGNVMAQVTYAFVTEMRSFGHNQSVSSVAVPGDKNHPATVSDTQGNIWVAWHSGPVGARTIHVAKRAAGASSFETPVQLPAGASDQCYPDVAVDAEHGLYVVWQDNSGGNWDVLLSTSADGEMWSVPIPITDSNDNEVLPVVAFDRQFPARAYVAWQGDPDGHQDVFVASSENAFANQTRWRVTTDPADQISPDLTVGSENAVYLVWTDMRNGQSDIYGAASNEGPWTNVAIVTGAADQSDPVVAAGPTDSDLHFLWVQGTSGDRDIYHVRTQGLPSSPVIGESIVDDTSGADQIAPAIVLADSGKVFACWQDFRHAGQQATDTDLFLAELDPTGAGTNVLVGDGGTNTNQSNPAIGLDNCRNPYIVWTDDRDSSNEIYFAATTFIDPNPLERQEVVAAVGATVGADPSSTGDLDHVSIVVPADASETDILVTISKVLNPRASPANCLSSFDFGPSGAVFTEPVTVTMAYRLEGSGAPPQPYWYDAVIGALTQEGITDIGYTVIEPGFYALRFKTTHFTPYYLVTGEVGSGLAPGGTGESGGGCSLSATTEGSPQDLLFPYAVVAVVLGVVKLGDRRKRRTS